MISINGRTYSGRSISVQNNVVTIDGKQVDEAPKNGILHVSITGDVASIEADGSVTVSGQVQGSVRAGGSVSCGNVGGNVSAGGSVTGGAMGHGGNISAGGSVKMGR